MLPIRCEAPSEPCDVPSHVIYRRAVTYETLGLVLGGFEAVAMAVVAVASYRRSRQLSGYPVWRSVLIAVLAAWFFMLWLIVWWVHRERIATEWNRVRVARAGALDPP
jgi:hypothetical protein